MSDSTPIDTKALRLQAARAFGHHGPAANSICGAVADLCDALDQRDKEVAGLKLERSHDVGAAREAGWNNPHNAIRALVVERDEALAKLAEAERERGVFNDRYNVEQATAISNENAHAATIKNLRELCRMAWPLIEKHVPHGGAKMDLLTWLRRAGES